MLVNGYNVSDRNVWWGEPGTKVLYPGYGRGYSGALTLALAMGPTCTPRPPYPNSRYIGQGASTFNVCRSSLDRFWKEIWSSWPQTDASVHYFWEVPECLVLVYLVSPDCK